ARVTESKSAVSPAPEGKVGSPILPEAKPGILPPPEVKVTGQLPPDLKPSPLPEVKSSAVPSAELTNKVPQGPESKPGRATAPESQPLGTPVPDAKMTSGQTLSPTPGKPAVPLETEAGKISGKSPGGELAANRSGDRTARPPLSRLDPSRTAGQTPATAERKPGNIEGNDLERAQPARADADLSEPDSELPEKMPVEDGTE